MRKKKQIDRLYTTSEVCDMYGLSASGLRFFEEKGLIKPERASGNRYRVFTLTECSRLFLCQILRQYGFKLPDSIHLLLQGTPEEIHRRMQERRAELQAEICEKQALLASLDHSIDVVSQLNKNPPFHIVTSPTMLRHCLDSSSAASGSNDGFRRWYAALPFTSASLYIRQESLLDEQPDISLGFIIESDKASHYGLHPDAHTTLLPARRCLYTIIHCNDTLDDISENLRPALDAISSMGFVVDGDPFSRMLGSADLGRGMLRFDEVWFPIAPAARE